MSPYYEHHLKTGSGWTKVILSFLDDGTVTTYYDSRWMGQGIRRYRTTWSHKQLSDGHGLLYVSHIEKYSSYDTETTIPVDLAGLV